MDSGNSTVAAPGADSGSRRRVPRGEIQRQGILDGFERLLEEIPARDISVKDIADAAGIKRPNFYFYFESKDDVLGELVGRAWDDWARTIGSYYRRAGESHVAYFDRVFGLSYAAWLRREHVMVAGIQATGYDDKLRARWTALVADLNRHLSAQMGRDATAGLITPVSDDHGALAASLTDMIVMAFFKDRSLKPSEAESARMLSAIRAIWLGAWGVEGVA
ncbi:TetR/AcrR family transcriptional regulator [Dietzia sp. PP-33]|jgi:AcrR family transcriptional regulator|uniref:TetR/AcrR family transcriptional regulator n=1 Tax=Dietzia sp. PP-33 TaxID=2957500 RepID=UPI0029AA5BC1|nr:TetR/AcrR family transcriptional regulator [Dietzia sp. PP-33]MDX2358455.1 TetR/AcrR family transcriptional regulator [Dietzia sp. PP-33]